jgi:hypothetical protein
VSRRSSALVVGQGGLQEAASFPLKVAAAKHCRGLKLAALLTPGRTTA